MYKYTHIQYTLYTFENIYMYCTYLHFFSVALVHFSDQKLNV